MHKELILVVDDSRQTADFVAKNILPSLGYDAMTAYSGNSALKIIREKHNEVSVMLLDLQMPEVTGLDIVRKTLEEGINIPAIIITAYGSEKIVADAFRLGVYDYIKKPVDVDKLNDAISRALSETRLRRETANLNTKLKDQVSWMKALSEIGRSVTSVLDLSTVLSRILEASVSLTRAEQGFIGLIDPESDRLFLRAVKNIDKRKIESMKLPIDDPVFQIAFETKRPVRKTRSESEEVLKVSTGLLVYSLVHVPILYHGIPIGILSVNNHSIRENFTYRDETVLLSLADYAGIAIGNANTFESVRQEIEERKRIGIALKRSEERFSLAVRGSNDGIWDWDLETNNIFYSPRWKQMLGYMEDEISNKTDEWFGRIFEDDLDRTLRDITTHIHKKSSHFINEHRLRHKDGTYRWILSRGTAVWNKNQKAVRIAGSISDITDQKNAEEQLLHDAFHDALTGLPNRALFVDRLNQTMERAKRNEDFVFAVLFLDLDNFKDVNDSIGHLVGDQLLVKVANRLEKGLRSVDTLARFGGDEYIILLDDIKDINGVIRITNWIHNQLKKQFIVSGHDIITTASIGIVISGAEYKTTDEIIRNADIAMYVAKDRGKGRSEVFDPSMRKRFLDRLSIETDLRSAIANNELHVHYQPIVIMETGELIGFEALIRWQHPEKGLLIPDDFIKIAEDSGIIFDIDRWILQEACHKISKWNEKYEFANDLTMSVNISGQHIANSELHTTIKRIIQDTKLNPKILTLEITELSLVDQNEITAKALNNLRSLGVQIQIDDFGIGYSSLNYLSRFPISALKIDQSFISHLIDGTSQRDIIKAIVNLTESLEVDVIAEGVETLEQVNELLSLGCKLAQGYHFSLPVNSTNVEIMLEKISKGNGNLPTEPV